MTEGIAVRTTTAVARTSAMPEGFENFGMQDMILPSWRIIQPTTQGVDPKFMGQFYNATSKNIVPTLRAVLLKMSHVRSYFKDVGDKTPICSSDDGIAPRVSGVTIGKTLIPATCATCPFSKWIEDESPVCASGYMLVAAEYETGDKFILRGMKTSAGAVKQLLNEILAKRVPLYGVIVEFSTRKGDSDKGNYYILQGKVAGVMPQDEQLAWRSDYLAVKGAQVSDVDDHVPFDEAPPAEGAEPAELQF